MISIGIVLLIVALCFYFGIIYTNTAILTIGYTLLVLIVISIVELVYRFFTISGYIDVPISMTEEGKPVNAVVRIRNKSFLPAGKVEVKVGSKNMFQKKGHAQWITLPNVSVGEQKHPLRLEIKGAGCHDILVKRMKIHSVFGLIYLSKKCKDFSSVLILPDIHSVNVQLTEGVRNFLGDADVYDEFRPGHDSGETFEIRAYREKDKLQSIHWKLSAKMDELMVKEHSLPRACAVVLMLEFHPLKQRKGRKKDWDASAYLELAASLSFGLMEEKCPHFVAWYSEEKQGIRRIRVDDEESFYLFLDAYLREAIPAEKDIREEYRKDYKNEWYLHDVTINEKLEIYKNGEYFTKLDEKKIKDECEKLEILL